MFSYKLINPNPTFIQGLHYTYATFCTNDAYRQIYTIICKICQYLYQISSNIPFKMWAGSGRLMIQGACARHQEDFQEHCTHY